MTTTLKPHLNTVNAAIHLNFDNDLKLCINFGLSSETDNQVTNITENSKYDYVQIPETGTIEICILDADKSRGYVYDFLVATYGKKDQYTYAECLHAYTSDSEYYYVQEER